MDNLITSIRNAIIRQEGMPQDCTNPGNLRAAPWLKVAPILGGFWQPTTRQQGIAGLDHVIALHIAQGNTLRDFIAGHPGVYAGFAPGADHNNPEVYVNNVASWTGLNPDTSLWEYL